MYIRCIKVIEMSFRENVHFAWSSGQALVGDEWAKYPAPVSEANYNCIKILNGMMVGFLS